MRLIAVRHCAVDVPIGVCYGHSDVLLAATFEVDSVRILTNLMDYSFTAVYSSPLSRCTRLAEVLSEGLHYIPDARLKELNFGVWEGCKWDDISDTKEAQFWFADWVNASCPGGESYQQLSSRVKEFLTEIKRKHRNDTVLLVTHGGVIRALHSLINKVDIQKVFDIKVGYGDFIEYRFFEK